MENEILILQFIFLFCIYITMMACYLLPVCVIQKCIGDKNEMKKSGGFRILSLCNCVSAGIFIGMCFLGLIPSVEEKFAEIFEDLKFDVSFPVGHCSVVMGYFFILTVEQLVLACQNRKNKHPLTITETKEFSNLEQEQRLLEDYEINTSCDTASNNCQGLGLPSDSDINLKIVSKEKAIELECDHGKLKSDSSSTANHCHSHDIGLLLENQGMKFYILFLAVSMHSLFEGVALGLQDSKDKLINLFIGIISHETLVAIAIGTNSMKLKYKTGMHAKFAFIFASTIPAGILLGLAIGATPGIVGSFLSATLQGIAAGTFIHVTFQEIIPGEFSASSKDRLWKIMFCMFGFMLILLVTMFVSHHH